MTIETLENRLTAVEAELAQLKKRLAAENPQPPLPWWEQIFGTFAGSEAHEEATRLGREYRESLRPKADEENQPREWRKAQRKSRSATTGKFDDLCL